jgi:hypothetical protein
MAMEVAVLRARIQSLLADVRKMHDIDLVGTGEVEHALGVAAWAAARVRPATFEEREAWARDAIEASKLTRSR